MPFYPAFTPWGMWPASPIVPPMNGVNQHTINYQNSWNSTTAAAAQIAAAAAAAAAASPNVWPSYYGGPPQGWPYGKRFNKTFNIFLQHNLL